MTSSPVSVFALPILPVDYEKEKATCSLALPPSDGWLLPGHGPGCWRGESIAGHVHLFSYSFTDKKRVEARSQMARGLMHVTLRTSFISNQTSHPSERRVLACLQIE